MDDSNIFDKIHEVDLKNTMEKSYIDYAMSVIVSRALPDVRDGLKPVQRRILYSMIELNNGPDKPHRKCARIVGDTMGKYHPHGDSSIYGALVNLAQDWSTRYPLVDGHGNFGSVDGDGAAAMRYTEARLSKISMEMTADIYKDTVDFVPNFDETEKEPSILPSRFPNLLVNGAQGIAVGMATNIPPHNLRETIDGVVKIIDNQVEEDRDTEIDELLEIVKGPDFPTGAAILGRKGIDQAYRTGSGMRICIETRKDVNANVLLKQLFKHTQLQDTFGVIMLALVDNQPKVLNLKEMLVHYLNHQKDVVTRRTKYELNKAKERAHILEGLLKALDYIDEVIEIIRASKNVAEARDNLIKRFEFSQAQAQAIVDMRLRALTGLEREKLQNEYDELEKKIAELEAILADEKVLLGVIREEILLIRDKYGDDRRTSIEMDMEDLSDEALIPRKDAIITFSKLGYIKRMTPDNFHSQNRGGKGIKGMNVIDEDHIEDLFMTSTHNYIMFFTNKGRVYRLKGYEIPESSRTARGVNIINLLQLQPEEKITAIIPLSEDGKQHYLVMATRNGIVKKTGFDEYKNVRKNGLAAISLREGDELIEVKQTDENEDIFLVSREGQCIRFKLQDVRETGRVSMGVIGMNLGDTDEVVGMQIHSEGDDLLIVSEKGMGKRTPLDEFTVQHRGGKGLRCYKITEKTGYVIGVKTIKPEEEIMLITTEGIVIRMKSDSISVIGRNTSGVKLINIDADSDIKVASVAKVRFQEEDESEDMEEDTSEVSEETVSDENEAIENETAPEEV